MLGVGAGYACDLSKHAIRGAPPKDTTVNLAYVPLRRIPAVVSALVDDSENPNKEQRRLAELPFDIGNAVPGVVTRLERLDERELEFAPSRP